ncbi:uncharacterized protein LOC142344876 isoform X2 [Convolutriloba macropyga]|uniref:uncharacterized protein LOC142344876 isoform X2 n=1 Tax=Convolutriloba macropyga TaxID=536237 RepID=UPI003F51EA76
MLCCPFSCEQVHVSGCCRGHLRKHVHPHNHHHHYTKSRHLGHHHNISRNRFSRGGSSKSSVAGGSSKSSGGGGSGGGGISGCCGRNHHNRRSSSSSQLVDYALACSAGVKMRKSSGGSNSYHNRQHSDTLAGDVSNTNTLESRLGKVDSSSTVVTDSPDGGRTRVRKTPAVHTSSSASESGGPGELTFVTHDLMVLWHPHGQSAKQQKEFLTNAAQILQRKSSNVRIVNISAKKNAFLASRFPETLDNLWPDYVSVSIEQLVSLIRKLQLMRVEGANQKRALLSSNSSLGSGGGRSATWGGKGSTSSPIVLYCHGDRGKIVLVLLCLLESLVKFKEVECWSKKEIDAIAKYVEPLHNTVLCPSYKKYWSYFRFIIWRQFIPQPKVVYLNFLTLRGVPSFEREAGFQVYFKIYNIATLKLQYISGIFFISHTLGSVSLKVVPTQPLAGDVLIRCYLTRSKSKQEVTKSADELSTQQAAAQSRTPALQQLAQSDFSLAQTAGTSVASAGSNQELIFQAQFNASAVSPPVASFSKDQLDKACDDDRFPADSSVELVISDSRQFQSGDVDLGTVLPASSNMPSSSSGIRSTESVRENSFVSTVEGDADVRLSSGSFPGKQSPISNQQPQQHLFKDTALDLSQSPSSPNRVILNSFTSAGKASAFSKPDASRTSIGTSSEQLLDWSLPGDQVSPGHQQQQLQQDVVASKPIEYSLVESEQVVKKEHLSSGNLESAPVDQTAISTTTSSFVSNISTNSIIDRDSRTSSITTNPFAQNNLQTTDYNYKFPSNLVARDSESLFSTSTAFSTSITGSSSISSKSSPQTNNQFTPISSSQGSQFQFNTSFPAKNFEPKTPDKRYAFQFDDFDFDLFDNDDFFKDFKPLSNTPSKFPVTSGPEGARVTFSDQQKKPAGKSYSNDTLLDTTLTSSSKPTESKRNNLWRSDDGITSDYDDPSKLAIGTKVVPFTDRHSSDDILEKVSPIGQKPGTPLHGSSSSTIPRKSSAKILSKSQDNFLGSSNGRGGGQNPIEIQQPPPLSKFPSEHSTETRTPHSAASHSAFNTQNLFEFPLEVNPSQSGEGNPGEISPAPKFPIEEFNFEQLFELEQENSLFEDHDYSVVKKQKEQNIDLSPESGTLERPFEKDTDQGTMRRFDQTSFMSSQPASQSQPTKFQQQYSPWGFQTYENPNTVTSPQTPGFPVTPGLQNSTFIGSSKFGVGQGPIPFKANHKQALPGSSDYPSFNFGRNRNRFQFSPTEASSNSDGNGSVFASPPYINNQINYMHDNLQNRWVTPQDSSTFTAIHHQNTPFLQTFGSGPKHTEATSKPIDIADPFNTSRNVSSFQITSSVTTQPQPASRGSIPNGSTYSSTSASPNQGSFKPNDSIRRNKDYNFQTSELDPLKFQSSEKIGPAALSKNQDSVVKPEPKQISSLFSAINSDFVKINGLGTLMQQPNVEHKQPTEQQTDQFDQNPQKTENTHSSPHRPEVVKSVDNLSSKQTSDRVDQLKADIKHHFLDAAPSKDELNVSEKSGPLSEDDKKRAQMYATLRKYKQKSHSFSTSVPNISKYVSSEGLSWKSTENLSGKTSGGFLRGNLESLKNSMRNLLDIENEDDNAQNTATNNNFPSKTQALKNTTNVAPSPTLTSSVTEKSRPRAASESARKPSTLTEQTLTSHLKNRLPSQTSFELRHVEEWIDRNSMTELSKTGGQKPDPVDDQEIIEDVISKKEKSLSPQRTVSSSRGILPSSAQQTMWNFGFSNTLPHKPSAISNPDRSLSPSSANSSSTSDASRQSERMNSFKRVGGISAGQNPNQRNNFNFTHERETSGETGFHNNSSIQSNRINDAFRNPFGELSGPGAMGTKSLISNPSDYGYDKEQNPSASQHNQSFKLRSSNQDLNQLFNSRTPLSSLNVGNTKLGSNMSDYGGVQQHARPVVGGGSGYPNSYGSLHRGTTLQNGSRFARPPLITGKERSTSFNYKDREATQLPPQPSDNNLHQKYGYGSLRRSRSAQDRANNASELVVSPISAEDELDKQVAELDNMCMELQMAVSSMLQDTTSGSRTASDNPLSPSAQKPNRPAFDLQPQSTTHTLDAVSNSSSGARFNHTSRPTRPSLLSSSQSMSSRGQSGPPPVASSAHFNRTLSPSRLSDGGGAGGVESQMDDYTSRFNSLNRTASTAIDRGGGGGGGDQWGGSQQQQQHRNRSASQTTHDSTGTGGTGGGRMSFRNRSIDQLSHTEGGGGESQYFNASDVTSPTLNNSSSPTWYRPHITRDDVMQLLRDQPSGSFIVRDSNTYPGCYALAIKVEHPPPGKQLTSVDELVRHYLVERNNKGLRVRGHQAEQYFDDLISLIKEHSIYPVSLPCRLLLPPSDDQASAPIQTKPSQQQQPQQQQQLNSSSANQSATLSHRSSRSSNARPPVAKRSTSLIRDSTSNLHSSSNQLHPHSK